jgi:hypothetical protein
VRPLQNALFWPIPASGLNFNPQNTLCIPVVKIFAFLGLEQNWAFFKGLTVCTLMESSSVMAWLEYPEVGILELRFQGLVPLKAGLHP